MLQSTGAPVLGLTDEPPAAPGTHRLAPRLLRIRKLRVIRKHGARTPLAPSSTQCKNEAASAQRCENEGKDDDRGNGRHRASRSGAWPPSRNAGALTRGRRGRSHSLACCPANTVEIIPNMSLNAEQNCRIPIRAESNGWRHRRLTEISLRKKGLVSFGSECCLPKLHQEAE